MNVNELAYLLFCHYYGLTPNKDGQRKQFFEQHSMELADFMDFRTNRRYVPPVDAFYECFRLDPKNGMPLSGGLEEYLTEWVKIKNQETTYTDGIPLPELPSEAEAEEQRLANLYKDFEPAIFDDTLSYPDPYCMLEYKGIEFSARKNIQAITGQKKNGKTFLVAELMAAILCGSKPNEENLAGLRVPQRTLDYLGHEPSVLYADTEMDSSDTAKVIKRVKCLCGWSWDVHNPRFNILNQRLTPRQDRWKQILSAIRYFKPDAVFIDGVRDLVSSINEETEATDKVEEWMREATLNDCCIWLVIHQNQTPAADASYKMRGWLGSEIANKGSDTLACIKDKKGHEEITFNVSQVDARGRDIEEWSFVITEQAGRLGIPKIVGTTPTKEKKTETPPHDMEDIRRWLAAGQNDIGWPASKTDIKTLLRKHGNVTNTNQQTADIQAAIKRRFLVADDEEGKNPKYRLNEYEFTNQ